LCCSFCWLHSENRIVHHLFQFYRWNKTTIDIRRYN
jgi:hypothetical protein